MMYIYVHMFMYISIKMYHPRERIWHKENKQADRFVLICVHFVCIWLVSGWTTSRLGFCLVYTFNGCTVTHPGAMRNNKLISEAWLLSLNTVGSPWSCGGSVEAVEVHPGDVKA
jgi:hypothetical protein